MKKVGLTLTEKVSILVIVLVLGALLGAWLRNRYAENQWQEKLDQARAAAAEVPDTCPTTSEEGIKLFTPLAGKLGLKVSTIASWGGKRHTDFVVTLSGEKQMLFAVTHAIRRVDCVHDTGYSDQPGKEFVLLVFDRDPLVTKATPPWAMPWPTTDIPACNPSTHPCRDDAPRPAVIQPASPMEPG